MYSRRNDDSEINGGKSVGYELEVPCDMAKKLNIYKKIRKEVKNNLFAYIIIVPILIHFIIFQAIPFFGSLIISFLNWRFVATPEFVGLDNWKEVFADPLFSKALWNTTLFTLYYVLPTMMLGLMLAIIINSKHNKISIYKGIYFLPVVTSFVVLAGIWKWLFTADNYGIVNYVLSWFGIKSQIFLSDPKEALLVLAWLGIFKVAGTVMVYYYGGLKSIPASLYESSHIDGANGWQEFRHITLPLLTPTTFYVAVLTTAGSFQVFDSAYVLTNGGPNNATVTIVFQIYQYAFTMLKMGYASALSYILFMIILAITLVQRKFLDTEVNYF